MKKTVAEFIEELKTYHQDMYIKVHHHDGGCCDPDIEIVCDEVWIYPGE